MSRAAPDPLEGVLGPAARAWLRASFGRPTAVQEAAFPRIAAGAHALLLAPTGSGKTLAAFLHAIDRLGRGGARAPGVRVLYVSPLKALVADVERNLRAPLAGVARAAEGLGAPFAAPRVAVRTGDTPAAARRAQARDPGEILVTTPESLYLILGSRQRQTLAMVETIIVDEIHALAATKRGAHLALSLERVAELVRRSGERGDPQRIGLSATARPVDAVAGFLGGDRGVDVVDARARPLLDLTLSVPVPDMTRPEVGAPAAPAEAAPLQDTAPGPPAAQAADAARAAHAAHAANGDEDPEEDALPPLASPRPGSVLAALTERASPRPDGASGSLGSLWPALHPQLLEAIRSHRSTLVFVNSRGLCERLAQRLNELAEEELVRAHHGSLSHEGRREIEEALKAGRLRGLVATSSLELGIDMGAIDLVLLVESPGAVSRGLQRVGRAGHRVGEASRGIVFPKHRGDLLEATVVAEGMRRGEVEALRVPRNPLDVLAQQIVAMCAAEPWDLEALEALVRRAAPYRELSREALVSVLDMLAGRYPSTDFAELRPRIVWDRTRDRLEARRGAGRIAILSGGTIPDRGLYTVHNGPEGSRVGELDEEMVHETRPGETITLGASTWRVTEITRDRVIVAPAPGEPGKLPFWRGEGPGRPVELGRALGRFVRELAERCRGREGPCERRAEGEAWLRAEWDLDAHAARNLVDYLVEQWETTGTLPSDRALTVERFRDELGDWRVCILSPFGARVHAPWALAIEEELSRRAGFEVQALWGDDGISLRFADAEEPPPLEAFLPAPDEIEDRVVAQLERSALFAAQFRENAARALLLPRRQPGRRTPLWAQRLRAQSLLAVAREFPSFPIVLETYRSCLQDVFDLPALREVLEGVQQRRIRVHPVETPHASPFARSLAFAWTAAYLYQGDTPVAERRAQALTLDRELLRDLLGQEELRELLDAAVVDEVEAELQALAPGRRARHPDALHDLLRRVGDLTPEEVRARCAPPGGEEEGAPSEEGAPGAAAEAACGWLAALERARRAVRVRVAGEPRWIAAEDAGLLRDALGAAPPPGLPEAFLEPVPRALERLLARFARRRGPFSASEAAARFGLVAGQVEPALRALEARGRLLSGAFHPRGGPGTVEWCDPEVLRQLKRRTLARLRGEVAPVSGRALARFLPAWHGVGEGRAGREALQHALDQLEGVPLPFSDLERAILPARVRGFDPRMLDELGALGERVWVGFGALGERDGRIAFYRRERVARLHEPPPPPDDLAPLAKAALEALETRGASFFAELQAALGGPPEAELLAALLDLVWAGCVTNDTLAPLRARSAPRGRRAGRGSPAGGRWASVASLLAAAPEPTERLHARAVTLLERYGVASREALALEAWPGGWSALYPVLRAMEEAGKVRRGHFVDGFQGAQFAQAGSVDRLRAGRPAGALPAGPQDGWSGDELLDAAAAAREDEAAVHVLAACDPAQPYGALLPWPAARSARARPRRAAGARVVLVDGELRLFLDRGGRRLWTFPAEDPERDRDGLAAALRGLGALFADRARGQLRVESVDERPVHEAPEAPLLLEAGFRPGYRGVELDRSAARAAAGE